MIFFIIPFRNREEQREVFLHHMTNIVEGDHLFIFVHQKDKRTFNRGAMKNIGFLYVREHFPNMYKDSTLIFHDIDFVPYKKDVFSYDTKEGVVNHFFGFKFALGGIFAIKGVDFEKVKGFPNYWGWGYEDNHIKKNWMKMGGKISHDEFIPIRGKGVIAFDSYNIVRKYNRKNPGLNRYGAASNIDTIKNVTYTIEDFKYNSKVIHVTSFNTMTNEHNQAYVVGTPPVRQRARKISFMSEIMNHGK